MIRQAGAADVERAVNAAAHAFPPWRDMPAQERAARIRAAAALRNNAEALAWIDPVDGGNPFNAMLYDVEISASYMEYFAGLVTEMKGATKTTSSRARTRSNTASPARSGRTISIARIGSPRRVTGRAPPAHGHGPAGD